MNQTHPINPMNVWPAECLSEGIRIIVEAHQEEQVELASEECRALLLNHLLAGCPAGTA